jgi:hypothetical protein
LKGFIALCSYYRRFVKDFAKIAKPLTSALRGNPKDLTWTSEMEAAFQDLKQHMMKPPVLCYPKIGERYYIECDGSKLGLGCVLSQKQEDGKLHPVAYGSRACSAIEERYGATDLEACAVIYALDQFDVYVRGHPITILSDHKAFKHILLSQAKLAKR